MAKKRKLDEILDVEESRGISESDESSNGTDSSTDVPASTLVAPSAKATTGGCIATPNEKSKRSVNFKCVTVYSFPRTQGFTCVPSEGGSTLGMASEHSCEETYTLTEYSRTKKHVHQLILLEQQQQQAKCVLNSNFNNGGISACSQSQQQPSSESEHSDEDSPSDDDTDLEIDDYFFLQPVSIRQRRSLLRNAGVKKIDGNEKDECREIRVSREVCGCDCKVYCDPELCACCLAGIKCQVDRLSFPCSCTKDGCANTHGRIEFNPIRVRTHFIHTLMRMELEKKEMANAGEMTDDGPDEDIDSSTGKPLDVSELNSNERGSCRDCQNSEVCHVMMREAEAQYARTLQEERQSFMSNFLGQDEFNINHINSVASPENHNNSNSTTANGLLLYSNSGDDATAFYNPDNLAAMGMYDPHAGNELKADDQGSYSESSDSSAENSADGCCNESMTQTPLSNLITSSENMSEFPKSYEDSYSSAVRSSTAINFSSQNGGVESLSSIHQPAVGNTHTPDLSSSTSPSLYKLAGVLVCESYSHSNAVTETPWSHGAATAAIDIVNDRNSITDQTQHIKDSIQLPSSSAQSAPCSYTTMTNTTSDRLAKNCPLISTHMLKKQSVLDSSDEKPVSAEIDLHVTFAPISTLTNVASSTTPETNASASPADFIFTDISPVQMTEPVSHGSAAMVSTAAVTIASDQSTDINSLSHSSAGIKQMSHVSSTGVVRPVSDHSGLTMCVPLLKTATKSSLNTSLSTAALSSHESSVTEEHSVAGSLVDVSHLSNGSPSQQQEHYHEEAVEQLNHDNNEHHLLTENKQTHVTMALGSQRESYNETEYDVPSNQMKILQQQQPSCDMRDDVPSPLTSDTLNGLG